MFSKSNEDRWKKLARSLDSLAERDRVRIEREVEIENIRKQAALSLYTVCSNFVTTVNSLVSNVKLDLTPGEFVPDGLAETHVFLFQINVSGRVVQFSFSGTAELESTEELRIPYTLHGAVRWFNQEMLDRDDVRDHRLYYCLERTGNEWRHLDLRSHRMGTVNEDYVASLLEELV